MLFGISQTLKHLLKKKSDTLVVYSNLKRKKHYIPIDKKEFTIDKIKGETDKVIFKQEYFKRRKQLVDKGLVREEIY